MRALVTLALIVIVSLAFGTASGAPKPAAPKPSPTATPNPTVAALSRASGAQFDVAFMRELIPVHEEAIEVAYAATLNADHTELLQWNQRMIDRKSGQVKQMLTFLQEVGAAPGRRNASVVTDGVKKMRSLRGPALERAYLPMIIAHLEQSTALARLAVTKATKKELRDLAQTVVRIESAETAMLRGWLKAWYGR